MGSGRRYTNDFITRLRGLCSETEMSNVYNKFVQYYGTHMYRQVRVGARSSLNVYASASDTQSSLESTFDQAKNSGVTFFNVASESTSKSGTSKKDSQEFSSSDQKVQLTQNGCASTNY